MKRLTSTIGILLAVTITNSAFGETKAKKEDPLNMDRIVSKAVALRGDAYLKQRAEILKAGKEPAGRRILAQLAKDNRQDFKKQLLVRACLLRLTSPEKTNKFESNLSRIVNEHQEFEKRVGGKHHLGPYDRMISANPRVLMNALEKGESPPGRKKLYEALKAVSAHDVPLVAECLVWHTEGSLCNLLKSYLPDKEGKLKGRSLPSSGVIAKFYLGQMLAIRPKGKSDAVAILTEWAKRDPNSSQFALKDLRAVALLKETSEADRKLAIEAIVRVGVALGKLDLPFDVKDYAASCLVRLIDETTLPIAGRVEAVRGCVRIGGKKALRYMKDIAKYSTNEKIKSAAEKSIRQIRETKPTSTTRPAEKPTTKPTRN